MPAGSGAMNGMLLGSLITAASLGATIYWEARCVVTPDVAKAAVQVAIPNAVHDAAAVDPNGAVEGWVATAVARPLFGENRRPQNELAGVANTDGPPRLAGVITGPFGNRAIFMVTAGDAKPITVREGAHIGNLVIRSIEPGQVVVEVGGSVRTMVPAFTAAEPGAAPAKKTNSNPGVIRREKRSSFDG
jgi:hypothetical protein